MYSFTMKHILFYFKRLMNLAVLREYSLHRNSNLLHVDMSLNSLVFITLYTVVTLQVIPVTNAQNDFISTNQMANKLIYINQNKNGTTRGKMIHMIP